VATRRRVVILTAASALVLVAVGVSVWLVLRPHKSDCAIVHDMLSYSKSENDRMRGLIATSSDDPQKMIAAYQEREARMHQYADQIHDAGLREKADAVVNLDDRMLDVWRKTIPGQSPTNAGAGGSSASQDFQRAYTDYAPQRQNAAATLQAACPVPS
jgi:hypothetical protein